VKPESRLAARVDKGPAQCGINAIVRNAAAVHASNAMLSISSSIIFQIRKFAFPDFFARAEDNSRS
jgi:hypothetical protein